MIWYDYLITFQMMNTIIAYHDLRPFKVRYTHEACGGLANL